MKELVINDEAMQLAVEIASMSPVQQFTENYAHCFFCGTETSFSYVLRSEVLDHPPFCTWLRCWQLAQPWLDEDLKKNVRDDIIQRQDSEAPATS